MISLQASTILLSSYLFFSYNIFLPVLQLLPVPAHLPDLSPSQKKVSTISNENKQTKRQKHTNKMKQKSQPLINIGSFLHWSEWDIPLEKTDLSFPAGSGCE